MPETGVDLLIGTTRGVFLISGGDARNPAGVYFGTNSGSVFGSLDEGDSWIEIARHLPTILSVEALNRR